MKIIDLTTLEGRILFLEIENILLVIIVSLIMIFK